MIGIGTGDPEHVTLGAVRALNQADVVFVADKGDVAAELRDARLALCRTLIDPTHRYRIVEVELPAVRDRGEAGVEGWRRARIEPYRQLVAGLEDGETGAFLAWGDPTLYDPTLAILAELARGGLEMDIEVVPGISSASALAARHGVSLGAPGQSVLVTTGRRLAEEGWPAGAGSVVVMADGGEAWTGADPAAEVFWAASLGLPGERLVRGTVGEAGHDIRTARAELRRAQGWVFDTYLVRPVPEP